MTCATSVHVKTLYDAVTFEFAGVVGVDNNPEFFVNYLDMEDGDLYSGTFSYSWDAITGYVPLEFSVDINNLHLTASSLELGIAPFNAYVASFFIQGKILVVTHFESKRLAI